ncbi:MAG: squalene/phytoene synthase family protein [Nisaea sp.]|uniref:phytoene/squalene synthase family protein n=1 Tax=Nisaea sp. TaxID=2024842 RepID=UPI001AFEDEAE|nr:squalene/phytoene synthase family protein [Nisaea sp.]MBO6558960.1 squalene/phytoene synthase family protein [Nisaea sp.]
MTDRARESDIAFCREIAGRANANLLHAARLLPPPRQDFFFASYAAMRLIDDRVDDDFLMRPAPARTETRELMLQEIDAWEGQCLGHAEQGPLPDPVRRAMQDIVLVSDLGETPWRGLADAMRRDVEEREMADWEDFLSYAEGATVAPATVFIYLLAAQPGRTGFHCDLPEAPVTYAVDLGIFCYLVHILRDLAKDAERSDRLVTIPQSLLAEAGLEKSGLSEAVRARDPRISQLAVLVRARANGHLELGRQSLARLKPFLGRREYFALSGLIRIYETLFERFSADFFEGLAAAPELELSLRADLLNARAEP